MSAELLLAALGWATLSIVVSQVVGITLMRWLGLSVKQLIHEIEDVQNVAVGASFFIISVTTSLFISVFFSAGFTGLEEFGTSALWFVIGLLLAFVYVAIIFAIAHRLMDRVNNETVYTYLRREIIEEQNAALAFFLGGLSFPPFISIVFQII